MTTTLIHFFPKHNEYNVEQHEEAIQKYRDWLDQHGRYGKLYMLEMGKNAVMRPDGGKIIIGVNIYEYDIAVLFKLMHEI